MAEIFSVYTINPGKTHTVRKSTMREHYVFSSYKEMLAMGIMGLKKTSQLVLTNTCNFRKNNFIALKVCMSLAPQNGKFHGLFFSQMIDR